LKDVPCHCRPLPVPAAPSYLQSSSSMPRGLGNWSTREGATAGRGQQWSATTAPFPPAGARARSRADRRACGQAPGAQRPRGPGHHGTGREGGVRSLRALTPRLVYMAEPGKNKIWGSQTARAFLLQSEQPQLEHVCDHLSTSTIG
jgi:hypothetical protein